ncbi:MAG: hypothetical protein MK078_18025 [Crocinitomicaceae bacterium]|nr:hypothetical protein [Crocinitomicaceae bacterium]
MKTLIPILTLLLLACGNNKEVTAVKEDGEDSQFEDGDNIYVPYSTDSIAEMAPTIAADHNVLITLSNYHPYCGGMAPTPEMLENQTSPYSNTVFIFIDKNKGTEERIKTDENGMYKLILPAGEYAIRETFKDTTFEAFYEQNLMPNSEFYSSGDKNCYKDWWEANLLEFEVTQTDTVYQFFATRYARCFTGNNPCASYDGPYPP